MVGPFRVHCQAVELARQPAREVTDVDHLLYFPLALGDDLAHLQCDKRAKFCFHFAQSVPQLSYDLAPLRSRQLAPRQKRLMCPFNDMVVFRLRNLGDGRNQRTIDRRDHFQLRA